MFPYPPTLFPTQVRDYTPFPGCPAFEFRACTPSSSFCCKPHGKAYSEFYTAAKNRKKSGSRNKPQEYLLGKKGRPWSFYYGCCVCNVSDTLRSFQVSSPDLWRKKGNFCSSLLFILPFKKANQKYFIDTYIFSSLKGAKFTRQNVGFQFLQVYYRYKGKDKNEVIKWIIHLCNHITYLNVPSSHASHRKNVIFLWFHYFSFKSKLQKTCYLPIRHPTQQ